MKKNEIFALDNFLTKYPTGRCFEEVLDLIESQHEDIIVWEPFEHDDPLSVCEKIIDMLSALDREYGQELDELYVRPKDVTPITRKINEIIRKINGGNND